MNIVFLHNSFPGQFGNLASALKDRGVNVLAVRQEQKIQTETSVDLVEYRYQSNPELDPFLSMSTEPIVRAHLVSQAIDVVKEKHGKVDLVIGHNGWNELGALPFKHTDTPYIAYSEGMKSMVSITDPFKEEYMDTSSNQSVDQVLPGDIYNPHYASTILQSAVAITPTAYQRELHTPSVREKVNVLHDGLICADNKPRADATLELKGSRIGSADKILTFCTRSFEPTRCYHHFMKSLTPVLEAHPDVKVCIAGGHHHSPYTPNQFTSQEFKSHYLEENIEKEHRDKIFFLGLVPEAVLFTLLQMSRCHVYLTLDNVPSWSYLNAMCAGAPIVTYDNACLAEFPEPRGTRKVPFGDIAQLSHQISEALTQPPKPLEDRFKDHQIIVNQYDFDQAIFPKWKSMIEEVTGQTIPGE